MASYVCITGAAGGLGKIFSAECASRGWNLFLTDISEDMLEPLSQGLTRLYGVAVQYFSCDLTDSAERKALWQHVQRQELEFHMLINVAGVEFEGSFSGRTIAELRAIVRLNIEATVELSRSVLEARDPTRSLHIINVSSLAGYFPMPVKTVYAASKRFIIDFSLALNQELRSQNVTVTVICPAGLPTREITINRILSQGFMGRCTTVSVGRVVSRTIDLALKGRAVYVPGFINRVLRILSLLLPTSMTAAYVGRRWGKRERGVDPPKNV
jgi:uncharacterized protein